MKFTIIISVKTILFSVALASSDETKQVSMLNAENFFLNEQAHGAALKAAVHGSALRGHKKMKQDLSICRTANNQLHQNAKKMHDDHRLLIAQHSWSHSIEIGIVTAPKKADYLERWFRNDVGWHRFFSDHIRAFTWDAIPEKSPASKIFHQVKRSFPKEQTTFPKGGIPPPGNLHLAVIQEMQDLDADWYFCVDDDTIVVPSNLRRFVNRLDPKEKEYLKGKCVGYKESKRGLGINFVVGGAGILMSRALVNSMKPFFSECRREWSDLYYSDARVGACMRYTMNRTGTNMCAGRAWSFTNGDVLKEVSKQPPEAKIITMHEKCPKRISLLNEWVHMMEMNQSIITWASLASNTSLVRALNKSC